MSGNDRYEFRDMVRRFHDAGIEVLLDVVYNHTCEGNHLGPTLSFRGIDNASYYRLLPGDPRFYLNESGCGNALNLEHPKVLQLVTDSLRYWVQVMEVDGFRFDLASVLGRDQDGFSARNAFFQVIEQDPVLSNCKLIAEPWDIGPGGYQLGHYPPGWSEWNDRYRDSVRRFWRGDAGELPELARRLHGSGDLFEHSGRRPYASINFVTSHDGFTLRDLVSFNNRHNQANLEQNRDGHRSNISKNHGVEGETDDPLIRRLRLRQQRNFLATLAVSQGVPMLLGGDELGRTQLGNNNAYCQDNEIAWVDWSQSTEEYRQLQVFVRQLLKIRQHYPVLQADRYRHLPNDPHDDSIQWLNEEGELMREQDWHEPHSHALGYLLEERTDKNSRYLFIIFNASDRELDFSQPETPQLNWWQIIDTVCDYQEQTEINQDEPIKLAPKSLKILSSEPLAELLKP
jgi:glycogen operon protein